MFKEEDWGDLDVTSIEGYDFIKANENSWVSPVGVWD